MRAAYHLQTMNVKAFVPVFAFFAFGCSSTIGQEGLSGDCTITNTITNLSGKLHGEPCTTNEECMYGLCHHSDAIASDPNIKFCTKRCDCGPNSTCTDEDGPNEHFVCQKYSLTFNPTEKFLSICSLFCKVLSDCPAPYDDCDFVTGPNKVCKMKATSPPT